MYYTSDPFAYNPEAPGMNRHPIGPPPFWQGPPGGHMGRPPGPPPGPPPYMNQPPPGMGPRPTGPSHPVDARDIIVSVRAEQNKGNVNVIFEDVYFKITFGFILPRIKSIHMLQIDN